MLQCVSRPRRGARPADPHLLGRPVPRVAGRAGARGHGRGSAQPPDLAHGQQDHRGQRDAGQQGARGDRGPPSLRAVVRRARGGGPSAEHRARVRRVLRRQRDRPARLPVHGAADPVRADPSGSGCPTRACAGSIRSRPARSPSSRCGPTSSARSAAGIAAGRAGGTAPAVFNAANEVAVAAFLEGGIPFGRISEIIERRARRRIARRRPPASRPCARPTAGRASAPRDYCDVMRCIVLTTVLALIVVLGVLVFVHEAGHFVAAKWAGHLRAPLLARPGPADPLAHLPARRDRVLDLLAAARRLREDGEPGGGHRQQRARGRRGRRRGAARPGVRGQAGLEADGRHPRRA